VVTLALVRHCVPDLPARPGGRGRVGQRCGCAEPAVVGPEGKVQATYRPERRGLRRGWSLLVKEPQSALTSVCRRPDLLRRWKRILKTLSLIDSWIRATLLGRTPHCVTESHCGQQTACVLLAGPLPHSPVVGIAGRGSETCACRCSVGRWSSPLPLSCRIHAEDGAACGKTFSASTMCMRVSILIVPGAEPQVFSAVLEPDVVVRRQEALAAARLKMQEELNAQVEKHKEKLRQLEEERRRQKIEMWDSMQEGRSYKGSARRPQEEDGPGPSTSSAVPKRKSDKKPLRGGGYNPLTGEGGGACSWRPGRRGGPSPGG
uniref:Selenoprotein S n=1 Tax=Oryctolagus cuniculus TaxID=9986 RepID=G1TLK0_RABIT